MRSEYEIRREVETRLKRRGLWLLDAGLGLLTIFFLYVYTQGQSFGEPWASRIVLFMLGWFILGIVHTAYVLYVEVREGMVSRAISREHEFYVLQDSYEKRKRDQALPRLTDDGELIDFPDEEAEERNYAQRSRNS